jgi:phosphopantothenoylcysteine decarboxylase/phosphopantothenate--cysteine ligase
MSTSNHNSGAGANASTGPGHVKVPLKGAKILFQLSGSIACFKACALLSSLVKAGFDIEVVATPSALKFVGEATLEGLTGRRVHTDTFESGRYMSHIHLMRWADLIILCPATANTLNKFASGLGEDLVSTLFLAHDFKKPYLVAPAMNQSMYAHPALQKSLSTLSGWGLTMLKTGNGSLACGENGEGRMLEPIEIQAAIESALDLQRVSQHAPSRHARDKRASGSATHEVSTSESGLNSDRAQKHILITSGGTEEPIDGVRSITNTSTGHTGAELATWFADHGANVTLLHSQ